MDHRYSDLATRLLASRAEPAAPTSLGDRPAAVAALEQALRRRSRRRVYARVAIASIGLSAAAAIAFFVGFGTHEPHVAGRVVARPAGASTSARSEIVAIPHTLTASARTVRGGGPTVVRQGHTLAVDSDLSLQAGDRLRTGRSGELHVALSSGTQVHLPASADLDLVELGDVQRFALRDGWMRADVAKLHTGQRFLIVTGDAEVEVKGTSFEVGVLPPSRDGRGRTCVRVFEGVVAVRDQAAADREIHVTAGTSWPVDCGQALRSMPVASAPHAVLPARLQPAAAAAPAIQPALAPVVAPTALPLSTLGEQNDLFAAALQARREGQTATALATLDELLARFPSGPLSESARAERRKLVAASADNRGR